MKSLKWVISLASALIAVSAAICAVIIFKEEIAGAMRSLKRRINKVSCLETDEYADFADV